MSVYYGNGSTASKCLPVEVWHNVPYVHPVVVGTGIARYPVFPLWGDAICTYGFNLPTLTYKGKLDDWSPIPYNDGRTLGVTFSSHTPSSSNVSVCMTSTSSGYAYLYPSSESVESAKQKLRGSNYSVYDSYLGVLPITMGASAWPSGSNVVTAKNTYCYEITSRDGNSDIKLLDGWIIYKKTGTRSLDSVFLDICWNVTGTTPNPCWTLNGDNAMQLSSDIATGLQSKELVRGTDYNFVSVYCNGEEYEMIHLNPITLGHGHLLLYPKIRVTTTSGYTGSFTFVQYGWTFGI